jgi:hypothetical protein
MWPTIINEDFPQALVKKGFRQIEFLNILATKNGESSIKGFSCVVCKIEKWFQENGLCIRFH